MARRLIIALMLVAALAGISNGQQIVLTSGATFTTQATVTLKVDAAGKLALDTTKPIIVGGTSPTPGPNPIPTPDPQPDPTTLNARAKSFKSLAEKVNDPTIARQLGALYQGMHSYITANPTVTRQQLEMAKTGGESVFLRDAATAAKWKPVTDMFQAEWVKLVQDGAFIQDKNQLVDTYDSLCVDAGNGLNAAAPNQSAMFMDPEHPGIGEQAITPDKIMEIIQLIIASGGKLNLQTIFQIIMILLSP